MTSQILHDYLSTMGRVLKECPDIEIVPRRNGMSHDVRRSQCILYGSVIISFNYGQAIDLCDLHHMKSPFVSHGMLQPYVAT